jgi:hypothetical protein
VPRLGDLKVVEVATLHDALAALHLVERQGPPPPPPHGLRAL